MSKYILNFIVFFVVLGLGVLVYQVWFTSTEEPIQGNVEIQTENQNNNMENNNQTTGEVESLGIEVLQQGEGDEAKNGDNVSVHYTGKLENGSVFDSSLGRGTPFEFTLGAGQVIQGWDLGVKGMKIGEKRKLTIAPELGYGEQDMGVIPPNSTLIFEVELLEIN